MLTWASDCGGVYPKIHRSCKCLPHVPWEILTSSVCTMVVINRDRDKVRAADIFNFHYHLRQRASTAHSANSNQQERTVRRVIPIGISLLVWFNANKPTLVVRRVIYSALHDLASVQTTTSPTLTPTHRLL